MSYRPAMTGARAGNVRTTDAAAIEAAHTIYTPLMLSFYDRLVHGLSNRFAWRCPTERLLDLYHNNLSSRHSELAPASSSTGLIREGSSSLLFSTLIDIAWRGRRAGLRATSRLYSAEA